MQTKRNVFPLRVLFASLTVAAIMAVILPTANIATAISITSLSKIAGMPEGGDEIYINGNGFILSERDEIVQVGTGSAHSVALTESGKVFTWGSNYYGALGNGTYTDSSLPQDITARFGSETVTKLVVNGPTFAFTESGKIFAWGYNGYGALGTGDTVHHNTPQDITSKFGSETVSYIYSNVYSSYAITTSGKVFAWGENASGQLGTGNTTNSLTPQDITSRFGTETVTRISVDGSSNAYVHVVATTASGKVFTWGDNRRGELGTGNNTSYSVPQNISSRFGSEKITQVATGAYTVIALAESGSVFTWGANTNGQIGNGTTTDYNTPQDITSRFGTETVTQIATGSFHNAALTESGKVFTWGRSVFGSLGNGSVPDQSTPQDISAQFGSETISQLAVGSTSSMVIADSGKVFSWGHNANGQLGTGNKTNYTTPQEITDNFGLTMPPVIQVVSIFFNSAEVTEFEVIDENTIRMIVPPHTPGKVDVTITGISGSDTVLTQGYEYLEGPGVPNTGA
ncbi:MAG: RCC1 domain-containing protein [Candidatus Saccharimonadales bacterium]